MYVQCAWLPRVVKEKEQSLEAKNYFCSLFFQLRTIWLQSIGWHLLTEIRRLISTHNKLKWCPNKGDCASFIMNYHPSSSSLSLWPLNLTVRTSNSHSTRASPQIPHLSCGLPLTPLPSRVLLRLQGHFLSFHLPFSMAKTHQCPSEFLFSGIPLFAKTNQADFTICVTYSAGYVSTLKHFLSKKKYNIWKKLLHS